MLVRHSYEIIEAGTEFLERLRNFSHSKTAYMLWEGRFRKLFFALVICFGSNLTILYLRNPFVKLHDERGEIWKKIYFRDIAHLFNGDIKKSLICFSDELLEISKGIYGNKDMSKYLNFYHVRYCEDLTPLERLYLEKKGIFGIKKAIKSLFTTNHKKIE